MASNFKSIEEIVINLNSYGRFQRIINAMFAIITIPACFHTLIMQFIEVQPDWRSLSGGENYGCRNGTIYPASNRTRCNIPSLYLAYTKTKEYSILTEFKLDCGNEFLAYIANSIYFLGWAVGAIFLGTLSNVYGRRVIIITSSVMVLSVGLISSFSPNIYIFVCCRFIIGIFVWGNGSLLHVLLGEFIDAKHRPLAGMIISVSYTVAIVLLGIKAYFIRNWRWLLRACSVPYLFIICFYKFIPESIRWLHLHGRKSEMLGVCKRMAYWNKREFPENFSIVEPTNTCEGTILVTKIYRNRKNLKLILVLMFNWFTANALYYALFLSTEDFDFSMYWTFIIFAVVEVPSNIIGTLCSDRFGRKKTVPGTIFIGGATSFAIAFLPRTTKLSILRIVLGALGIGCLNISSNFLITWSVEILTTDVRSVGMGIIAAAGRVGGISAPWIAKSLRIVHPSLPYLIIGGVGILSGFFMLLLPETKGVAMKDERYDVELETS